MATLLIHTLVFAPDGVSTAYLMSDLASELQRHGHRVLVLTSTPHYNEDPEQVLRQPLRSRWAGLLALSEYDGIPVWHIRMRKKGNRVKARLVDYVLFHALSLVAAVAVVPRFDIVLTPSPPLTMGLIGKLLGLLRRAPSIYNIQEIYPDFAINQGVVKSRVLIAVMRVLERMVYRVNDLLTTISPRFASVVRTRTPLSKDIRIVPNFVDLDFYRPIAVEDGFAERHGFAGRFVVYYGGNIGISQDWELFLTAAERLRDLRITFVVTGDGARMSWLAEQRQSRRIENLKIFGYVPKAEIPLFYAAAHVATIPMRSMPTPDSFPSKIYTLMAAGKPIIVATDADSDLADLVRISGAGDVVEPGDVDGYVAAIRRSYTDRAQLAERGMAGREYVEREYSKPAVAARYDAIIRELTSRG